MKILDIFTIKIYYMAAFLLKSIPEDVRKIVVREQSKIKEKTGTNKFGIEPTIYEIIREWEARRVKKSV